MPYRDQVLTLAQACLPPARFQIRSVNCWRPRGLATQVWLKMRSDIRALQSSGREMKAKRGAKQAQPADGRPSGMSLSPTLSRILPVFGAISINPLAADAAPIASGRENLEMASGDGEPIGREAAFPTEMQGRWVEESEPSFEVIVNGSEITWRGIHMDYQAKKVTAHEEGWVAVEIEFADQTDSGDALNLVAWPKGDMHAFNDHGVSRFVRTSS